MANWKRWSQMLANKITEEDDHMNLTFFPRNLYKRFPRLSGPVLQKFKVGNLKSRQSWSYFKLSTLNFWFWIVGTPSGPYPQISKHIISRLLKPSKCVLRYAYWLHIGEIWSIEFYNVLVCPVLYRTANSIKKRGLNSIKTVQLAFTYSIIKNN